MLASNEGTASASVRLRTEAARRRRHELEELHVPIRGDDGSSQRMGRSVRPPGFLVSPVGKEGGFLEAFSHSYSNV